MFHVSSLFVRAVVYSLPLIGVAFALKPLAIV